MSFVISFVSQKGGVGKTTSAINLSVAFAFAGYSTLIIDIDPQSSIKASLSHKTKNVKGCFDFFMDLNLKIKDVVQPVEESENLHFMQSNINSLKNEKNLNQHLQASDYLDTLIKEKAKIYDIIILDAPSSVNNLSINALHASQCIILPIQCEKLAVESLKRFVSVFHEFQQKIPQQIKIGGVLLTMYDVQSSVHQSAAKQLIDGLDHSVFKTIIPRHESLIAASAKGKSVFSYSYDSVGAIAYIRLMKEIELRYNLS